MRDCKPSRINTKNWQEHSALTANINKAVHLIGTYSNKSAWRRCDNASRTRSARRVRGARLRDTSAIDVVRTRYEDAMIARRRTRAIRNESAAMRTKHDAMTDVMTEAEIDVTDLSPLVVARNPYLSLALRAVLPADHVLRRLVLAARVLAAADKLAV
jgi:DNA-directed RNA polymerase subunit K/omega